jgi:hypothetical protein
MLIESCLKGGSPELIPVSTKRIIVARVIKSVKKAIPNYAQELTQLALKIDPVMKTLI